MICRHAPHGGVGDEVSATTAILVKDRLPFESALKIATRLGQIFSP
jgi:hypothetical protein